ncbi:MAG TPA: hypothetical protein VFM64_04800 [Candidatus Nitrosotenuis sp.]|nr:hypothetical protein [Candidatus Nitrosotenuis sp.]
MNKIFLGLSFLSIFILFSSFGNYDANAQNANSTSTNTNEQDVVYPAKFVCGSITDERGPLRPGHYDTSINILNKKSYQIDVLWTAVVNDGPSSIAIFKSLESERSTGITCSDIKGLLGIDSKDLAEGFVIIKVPLSSLRGFSNQQVVSGSAQDNLNILDVQIFYTANALTTLPHEVVEEKISFYVIQDGTQKIPKDSYRTLLDITLPATINEISNTEQKVKSALAEKYGIEESELDKVRIRIHNVSIGVGALLDDHAVSLYVVKPQFSS